MSQWVHTFNIALEWQASKENESLVYKTAQVIVAGLKSFNIKDDDYLDIVIEEFDDIACNKDSGYDQFNYCMNHLYDWSDMKLDNLWNGKKNCWVERGV